VWFPARPGFVDDPGKEKKSGEVRMSSTVSVMEHIGSCGNFYAVFGGWTYNKKSSLSSSAGSQAQNSSSLSGTEFCAIRPLRVGTGVRARDNVRRFA
jgi:hypothetical protein